MNVQTELLAIAALIDLTEEKVGLHSVMNVYRHLEKENSAKCCDEVAGPTPGRELTLGEKAVGVSFKPSSMPPVDFAKRSFAELIDLGDKVEMKTRLGSVIKTQALTTAIAAQMALVKLLTFRE